MMIVRRSDLKVDGWTYGDWRQYVAFLPDGSAICCRIAGWPSGLAMVGFVALSLPLMGLFFAFNGVPVNWSRIIATALIGLLALVPWAVTWFTRWRFVVPVSGKMWPDEQGSYWRDI